MTPASSRESDYTGFEINELKKKVPSMRRLKKGMENWKFKAQISGIKVCLFVCFGVRGSSGQFLEGQSNGPVEGMPFRIKETGSLNDAHLG